MRATDGLTQVGGSGPDLTTTRLVQKVQGRRRGGELPSCLSVGGGKGEEEEHKDKTEQEEDNKD